MACTNPQRVYQHAAGGAVSFTESHPDGRSFHIPCGVCLSCRTADARAWSVRCMLEAREYGARASFVTLTYDNEHCPEVLRPRDLQLWLKRLRKLSPDRIRYFACGEYGEQFGRPHFHALLFGVSQFAGRSLVPRTWPFGRVSVDAVSGASIAYTCGYVNKKIATARHWIRDSTYDPDTGEVLYEWPDGSCRPDAWQPPFRRMSRGLGYSALRAHARSFRRSAIVRGREVPAPRVAREFWRETASTLELAELEQELAEFEVPFSDRQRDLAARAEIALQKHHQQKERRRL